jgi:hypothetical protein
MSGQQRDGGQEDRRNQIFDTVLFIQIAISVLFGLSKTFLYNDLEFHGIFTSLG